MTFRCIKELIIKISAIILLLILCTVAIMYTISYRLCFSAAEKIPAFSSVVQIRFLIFGISEETISGKFWFYSSTGSEIAVIERSWSGSSLYIDFASASFNGKTLQFPANIHTNFTNWNVSERGYALSKYYLTEDGCNLYPFTSKEQNQAVARLARYALRPDWQGKSQSVGGSKHRFRQRVNLAGCESGVYYSVITDSYGNISLIKE
jgi:hypothetical protein